MFWSVVYFLLLIPSIIGLIQINNMDTNYNNNDKIKIYIVATCFLDFL
ncbi:hypothetical protein EMELA_v1c07770 [Mesoplasma melaleucae]|uniref:Uncharacterized protein n=1 Tax=Mesoplasma melaleucae TaxID=81459 RepID=A0A2K8NWZ9_9MOLU|nr:hypothetical protein EMELA_v1c07770 [Mesoplasma melaleucae]